jgi:glycerol-3-phosphate acyltransferase PlsY
VCRTVLHGTSPVVHIHIVIIRYSSSSSVQNAVLASVYVAADKHRQCVVIAAAYGLVAAGSQEAWCQRHRDKIYSVTNST